MNVVSRAPGMNKIAVLRAGGIGDLVFALPALHSLRRAFPSAEIVLLGKPWHHELLSNRQSPVDRVVIIPTYKGVGADESATEDQADIDGFFAEMRQERFDVAIQMHGGGRYSNAFVKRLGARLTVGSKTPDAIELDRWAPYFYFQSEIFRLLELVTMLGVELGSPEVELPVTARDLEESEAVIPSDDRPLAALAPGAGDGRRRWAPEKFGAVGDVLASKGLRVVVVGNQGDTTTIDAVRAAMNCPSEPVVTLTLGGLLGLMRRARIVLGNDTGPMHLARVVGTPTVAVYWCGNMITAGCLTRRRHLPAISWRLTCPICGRNTMNDACDHCVSFVDDVSVDEVVGYCLSLLGSSVQ